MATGKSTRPSKIISGGQTGVDRAALDAAIELGIPHGGWCPAGRRSEDGRIPDRYQLAETDSTEYRVRTERNLLDSDGTLIVCRGKLRGGTKLTRRFASRHDKPCFVVDLQESPEPEMVRQWIRECKIATLNIAGPRESQQPGIAEEARQFIAAVLTV